YGEREAGRNERPAAAEGERRADRDRRLREVHRVAETAIGAARHERGPDAGLDERRERFAERATGGPVAGDADAEEERTDDVPLRRPTDEQALERRAEQEGVE